MYFVIIARDKPTGGLRAKLRTAHLEFIADKQQLFRFGGPLIDEAGSVTGSLMIFDLPDRVALDTYRSEEHTSELQSLMRISYAVFCLKKKKNTRTKIPT